MSDPVSGAPTLETRMDDVRAVMDAVGLAARRVLRPRQVELGDRRWRELLEKHHEVVRANLARFRGRELDVAGDGFFASFDGPARAIRCATAVVDAVAKVGVEVRAGLTPASARWSTARWAASPFTSPHA